jgi:hypothetical protein
MQGQAVKLPRYFLESTPVSFLWFPRQLIPAYISYVQSQAVKLPRCSLSIHPGLLFVVPVCLGGDRKKVIRGMQRGLTDLPNSKLYEFPGKLLIWSE